jgi:hypothetical protein
MENVVRIISKGSMKKDLHAIAESIIATCRLHSIYISAVWIPREFNQFADYLSKCIDWDDWSIQPHVFNWLYVGASLH